MMRLTVILPAEVFAKTDASRIRAEGPQGRFCLLPRHADMVSPLVPSILSYVDTAGEERFAAVDQGMLVKVGADVRVACRRAVAGRLGELEAAVQAMTELQDDRERAARTATSRLEADFVRQFMGFGGHG